MLPIIMFTFNVKVNVGKHHSKKNIKTLVFVCKSHELWGIFAIDPKISTL